MQRFFSNFFLFSLLLVIVIIALMLARLHMHRPTFRTITVGATQLTVEEARTPAQTELGLGHRDKVLGDGMLFYLPQPIQATFWMKGMRFALDFVWINNGKVVDLTENVPPPANPQIPDAQLPLYQPSTIVTHVLEVPAGFVQLHKIRRGDAVSGL
jgi:uncharacterized membrane protein (UPF0127 family)